MTKLIWVAVLAVGCGAPFEADLFGGSLDADGGALDGDITPSGDAMGDALPDALEEVDGGAGGSQPSAGGAGGVTETGGRPSSGGSSSGGALSAGGASSGGSPPVAGGAPSAGGSSSGGAPTLPCDGAGYVTHDNGLGQTWEDCVPLYTWNRTQALRACQASEAVACVDSTRCGLMSIHGFADAELTESVGEWGYTGSVTGKVSPNHNLCGSNDPEMRSWG